ncbi:diguanylate cyclase [Clostridium sp. C8-1-8]|uniref:sensor domain-containing diguanylate cyclase n=1 Tax=Clostridium sp. C8-1-8 TaxID=2698831 RepID=UPI00137003E6|nr:diguanylate cyclase [Clostridium sp. C8-1-8]
MKKDFFIIILFSFLILFIIILLIKNHKLKNNLMETEEIKKEIYNMGKKISNISSKNLVYEIMLQSAMTVIDKADRGSVFVLEDDGYFYYKAVKGYSKELLNMKLKKEDVYLYRLNKFGDIHVLNLKDSNNKGLFDDEVSREIDDMGDYNRINSVLFSPIYVDDKVMAVINLDITRTYTSFNKDDIVKMRSINHELELALKNFLSQQKLRYIATHDELTNLYNRRSFKDNFSRELIKINREKHTSQVALIDLDDFKLINDNYGHNEGDRALTIMSEALRFNLDTDHLYARMSGDEFVIVFKNCSAEEAKSKILNIKKYLHSSCDERNFIDFSYGLAEINGESKLSMDEILSIADRNMYINKKEKKAIK